MTAGPRAPDGFRPPPGSEPFRHLYVHIPFCRHRCGYCDFNVYAGQDRLIPDYVEALCRELERAADTHRFGDLRTVYFGGGTPSLLPPAALVRLMVAVRERFRLEPEAEVTLEANPASTDQARLDAWREAGINRLSLGVQGFDPRALAVLERRTDGALAVPVFELARRAGFANVSLDLIFGVPYQSLGSWLETLRRAVALAPEHLSCYCLAFEPGTLLHRRRSEGRLPEVDPDEQWRQLDATVETLAAAGYRRYEVSSWARPGRESVHNQAYWRCVPVYGAGAGAHSYAVTADGRAHRWWNAARIRDYIAAVPSPAVGGESLDPDRAEAERVMLGLRQIFGVEAPERLQPVLDALARQGLVEIEGGRCRPTRRGLDLHSQVAQAVL